MSKKRANPAQNNEQNQNKLMQNSRVIDMLICFSFPFRYRNHAYRPCQNYPGARRKKIEKMTAKTSLSLAEMQAELLPLSNEQREANNRGPRRRWREQIIETEARKKSYRRRRGRRYETRTRDIFS